MPNTWTSIAGALLVSSLALAAARPVRADIDVAVVPAAPTTQTAVTIHIVTIGEINNQLLDIRRNGQRLIIDLLSDCGVLSACESPTRTYDLPFGYLPAGDYTVETYLTYDLLDEFQFTVTEAGPPPAHLALEVAPAAPTEKDKVRLLIATETAIDESATLAGWSRQGNTFRVEVEVTPQAIVLPPPGPPTVLGALLVELGQLRAGAYVVELRAGPPEEEPALVQTVPFAVVDAADAVTLLGRYRASIVWETRDGQIGPAKPVAGNSAESALFSFFSPDNWEVMVKVLDGCAINGHRWVFLAAATDVEFTLTIEDLEGDAPPYVYTSAAGLAPPLADTAAFACSP